MEIFQHFKDNLVLNSEQILLKEVKGQKFLPGIQLNFSLDFRLKQAIVGQWQWEKMKGCL